MTDDISIVLRKAQHGDTAFLWYVRNRPDVYCYFNNPEPVSWEDHVQWLEPRILGLVPSEIFIIEVGGVSAGQVRLDYGDNDVTMSISLLKEFRGKGVASRAVGQVCELVKSGGRVRRILAEIYRENIASLKLFERAGFLRESRDGDPLIFIRTV